MIRLLRKSLPAALVFVVIGITATRQTARAAPPASRAAMCRVHNQLRGSMNIGSGTLIDTSDDYRQGLVLTCAHLFTDGVGQVVVQFPQSKTHQARLVAIDRQADLAALVIGNPDAAEVDIGGEAARGDTVSACGFGSDGTFRCATGAVVGAARSAGQQNLLIDDPVRSGDSGGAVFDSAGRLVAVVWGESAGITYASTGAPLRRFLQHVLGSSNRTVTTCPTGLCPSGSCPNGVCPRQPLFGNSRPQEITRTPAAPRLPRADDAHLDELRRRIAAVEQNKQDRGDYVLHSELTDFASSAHLRQLEAETRSQHNTLLARIEDLVAAGRAGKAVGSAVARAAGISGPIGWALLAAATIGGALTGRYLRRRGAGGRRAEPFPGG